MLSSKAKFTKLQVSGLEIPAAADWDIREKVKLIGAASDIRRTVNGEAINVARSVFRKYAISISGDDLWAAGLSGFTPGDYVEVIPSEPFSVSLKTPGYSVELPRAGINIVGITSSGARVEPSSVTPSGSPLPLQTAKNATRIATLRTKPTCSFSEPVALVRFRPALSCVVINWETSTDERAATASWSADFEEL